MTEPFIDEDVIISIQNSGDPVEVIQSDVVVYPGMREAAQLQLIAIPHRQMGGDHASHPVYRYRVSSSTPAGNAMWLCETRDEAINRYQGAMDWAMSIPGAVLHEPVQEKTTLEPILANAERKIRFHVNFGKKDA